MLKLKNHQKTLLLICSFGLIFRLLGLINTTLSGDFAYHWHMAGGIITKGIYPLLGPAASMDNSFHLGPLYYYLLAIPYFFGKGNYHAAIIFFSLLSTFSIFVFYYVCQNWFTVPQSLKMTALYAFSSYMIAVQSFPWNPYILPAFIIFSLYCIVQSLKGKYIFVTLLFLCFSILLQAHATTLFLLPVFAILLPIRKIPLRFYAAGLVVFLLFLAPWIFTDLTTNFSQTRAGLAIFQAGKTEQCSFLNYIVNHGHGERCFSQIRNSLFISRIFTMSLFNTQNILIVFLALFTIIILLLQTDLLQRKLIFSWIVIPTVFFLFYSSNVYLHYFLILIPMPFFLFVLLLEKLNKLGKLGQKISTAIFFALIIFNIGSYLFSLQTPRG